MGLFDASFGLSGLGGSFLDDFTGKSQEKQEKGGFKRAIANTKLGQQDLMRILDQLLSLSQQRIGAIDTGFQGGLNEISRARGGLRQDAFDQSQRQAGGLTAGLISNGGYNTTVAGGAQRAVGSDLARALAAVDTAQAQARAGLQVGRGQAKAGALADLGGVMQWGQGANQALLDQLSELLIGKSQVKRGGLGEYVGGALPGVLGGILGG